MLLFKAKLKHGKDIPVLKLCDLREEFDKAREEDILIGRVIISISISSFPFRDFLTLFSLTQATSSIPLKSHLRAIAFLPMLFVAKAACLVTGINSGTYPFPNPKAFP